MGHELFARLYEYFVGEDFQVIPTDSDNVVMFADGLNDSIYLINLIELSSNYAFNRKKYNIYRQLTKMQFSKVGAANIILLNILLIDDAERIYDEVNYTSEEEEGFVDIHWIIDTRFHDLIIPKKQKKEVIGLENKLGKVIVKPDDKPINIRRHNKVPIVTAVIIIINIIMWFSLIFSNLPINQMTLSRFGGMYLYQLQGAISYYTIFTNMFIHISPIHLIFNSFYILILGTKLERYLKWWQFMLIYIGAGISGSVLSIVYRIFVEKDIIVAGAGSSVFGIIGSMLLCTRIMHRSIDGLSEYHLLLFLVAGSVFIYLSPSILDSIPIIGGFFGGLLITYLLLYRRRKLIG